MSIQNVRPKFKIFFSFASMLSILACFAFSALAASSSLSPQTDYLSSSNFTSRDVSIDCDFNPWQYTSSLNVGRYGHAAVTLGNHIYAIGGEDVGPLDSVEYAAINPDGTLGQWQIISHMIKARYNFASAVANGHIFAIGGEGDSGALSSAEQAEVNPDGTLGSWQSVTPPITPRSYLAAVVAGNYLYVLGGRDGSGRVTNSVERAAINVDGALGAWQFMSSMNTARSGHAAVVTTDTIYVLGGSTNNGITNSVERAVINADGTLGPWEMVSSMLEQRLGPTAISTQGFIYALAGYLTGTNYIRSVERAVIHADSTLGTWEYVYSLNAARWSAAATIVNNRIYEIGGAGLSEFTLLSVEWSDATELGVPPENNITINNGSLFTNQISVTLTISAQPGTTQMKISNDGGFAGAQWEPCTLSKLWTITQYGSYIIPRVVYIRFKDRNGNVSATYQDDIILDVTPPSGTVTITPSSNMSLADRDRQSVKSSLGQIQLQSSESYTYSINLPLIFGPSPIVTLHLYAQDDVSGVEGMIISNSASFTNANWEQYATTKQWEIPSWTGTITVYVKFRDFAGNVSSVIEGTYTP